MFIYGYRAQLPGSLSIQGIEFLALKFRGQIQLVARSNLLRSTHKPLILVAHSLEGIIVRERMVQLGPLVLEPEYNLKSILGIITFGVAIQGMSAASLQSMVKRNPDEALVLEHRWEETMERISV